MNPWELALSPGVQVQLPSSPQLLPLTPLTASATVQVLKGLECSLIQESTVPTDITHPFSTVLGLLPLLVAFSQLRAAEVSGHFWIHLSSPPVHLCFIYRLSRLTVKNEDCQKQAQMFK